MSRAPAAPNHKSHPDLLNEAIVEAHIELLHKDGYHNHAELSNQTRTLVFPTAKELAALGSRHVEDLTRGLLHSKIEQLEVSGLGKLEEGACAGVCAPCSPFCHVVFTSSFATTVNKKIVSIPVVKNINNWLADSVADVIPSGAR